MSRWCLNGVCIPSNIKRVPEIIMENMPDVAYWSTDAIRELYKGLMEIVIEMAEEERKNRKGGEKAKYTRLVNSTKRKLHYVSKDRNMVIRQLYNYVLANEGCGLLRGFGMSNKWGDPIQGDPEKQTIYPRR